MKLDRDSKERTIENFLNKYNTYKIGMKNYQQQLDYMMPSLTVRYDSDGTSASYYISNNTEKVAIDRITSKKALDLLEEIERFRQIVTSIDNAMAELDERQRKFIELRYFKGLKIYEVKPLMNVSEDKTIYRIRSQVLEKFKISLGSLMNLK